MPLTKQQLLIPRVLCIGGKDGEPNYPGSPYKSGDILEVVDYFILIDDICSKLIYNEVTNAYPELFRPLPWWYGRTESELPKYVKEIKSGKVHKASWDYFREKGITLWSVIIQPNGIPYNPDGFEPADLTDYLEYQKQKEA